MRLQHFIIGLSLLLLLPVPVFAQLQVRVVPVLLAPIIEELPLTGSVLSPRSSDLAPQESGLVEQLLVDEGDRVETGDVLVELDAELTRLELRRLESVQQEARLLYEDAKRLADEARRLINDKNISKSEYDSRLATEAAREKQLGQIDVQLQMQAVRLENHSIKAPFAGVIGQKHTEIGQWLNAGSPALRLVQLDPLRIQARIPERYYGEVQAGTPVEITFDAFPGEQIDTTVDSLVPVSDISARSFVARVDIPNSTSLLAPGMSAQLVFSLSHSNPRPVLQVPADAIVRRADGSSLVWVVRDQTAVPIVVTVGRRNNSQVEVRTDQLNEGDLAVTLGNESLRPGQNVTAVQANSISGS